MGKQTHEIRSIKIITNKGYRAYQTDKKDHSST